MKKTYKLKIKGIDGDPMDDMLWLVAHANGMISCGPHPHKPLTKDVVRMIGVVGEYAFFSKIYKDYDYSDSYTGNALVAKFMLRYFKLKESM